MKIDEEELQKMMAETMTAVNAPYLTAVREALDVVARIEERLNYAERIARIEERLDQLERRLEREGPFRVAIERLISLRRGCPDRLDERYHPQYHAQRWDYPRSSPPSRNGAAA